ncbi:unnamed protein product (mitochondrion) [Musa textilis]
MLIRKLQALDEWEQVYKDPELVKSVVASYNTIRAIYEDLKVLRARESSLKEIIENYLKEHGWPEEYSLEDLGEKSFLLDWLSCHLLFGRPIKTKQLLLYGEPSTQKTLLFDMLNVVLNIYYASTS